MLAKIIFYYFLQTCDVYKPSFDRPVITRGPRGIKQDLLIFRSYHLFIKIRKGCIRIQTNEPESIELAKANLQVIQADCFLNLSIKKKCRKSNTF